MGSILLAYEFGGGLGHLNRLIAVAERLSPEHRLIFAIPSRAAGEPTVRRKLGDHAIVRDGVTWKVVHGPGAADVPTHTLADALRLFGFADKDRVQSAVAHWGHLLREFKPDLIISDFAPTLRIAAGRSIPIVVVGNGYTLPPGGRTLPPIRPWQTEVPGESRVHEYALLSLAIDVSQAAGGVAFDHLADLFHGTRSFVCTFAEFDPYRRYRREPTTSPFNIPNITAGPPLEQRSGPAAFVYMSNSHPQLRLTLQAINQSGLTTQIYVGGVEAARVVKAVKPHVAVHVRPADFGKVIPQTRVLVHHGGLGTAYAGLAAGTTQLILPLQLEHLVTARGVADFGGGQVLQRNTTVDAVQAAMKALSKDDVQSRSALRGAARLAASRDEDSLKLIVAECGRHCPSLPV